jgi:hypothetical protein
MGGQGGDGAGGQQQQQQQGGPQQEQAQAQGQGQGGSSSPQPPSQSFHRPPTSSTTSHSPGAKLALYGALSPQTLTTLERLLLHSLLHETSTSVRAKAIDTICDVSNQGMGRGRPWHALQAGAFELANAEMGKCRSLVFFVSSFSLIFNNNFISSLFLNRPKQPLTHRPDHVHRSSRSSVQTVRRIALPRHGPPAGRGARRVSEGVAGC